MWEKLKGAGAVVAGIAIFLGIALLIALFIHGGAWLGEKIYPWLVTISSIALAIVIFVLLPLVLFRKTRGFSGTGLMIASFIFGFTLWVWSLLLTYHLWGAIAVFIGLFLMGVGVVPIAMLATLFKGMWSTLGELVVLTVLTFGTRFAGAWATAKADEY
ncbi:MAG TPA: hypothetical protein VNN10_08050 [Dehalococcoidia bacterium]|nr:hypothetical protein [Dehalococcoidia bacterium]